MQLHFAITLSFLSQPSLETALQNINLKLRAKSINRKSNFQLRFFLPYLTTLSVLHWIYMYHCIVSYYFFSNINHVAWVVINFSGNPYKVQLCYLVKFIAFVVAVQHICVFSLDFSILVQDLGKFQKHRWLHASRMYCNVCLIVNLKLFKEL